MLSALYIEGLLMYEVIYRIFEALYSALLLFIYRELFTY